MKIIFTLIFCCFFEIVFSQNDFKTQDVMHPAPVVNYTVSGLCLGNLTSFTNKTILAISYEWVIGKLNDTTSFYDTIFYSTNTDIQYTFIDTGYYEVKLTGENGHVVTVKRIFHIGTTTLANFDYIECLGQFNNLSICANSVKWDFGDGKTSTDENPTHQYVDTGTYQISLTAFGNNSNSTAYQTITHYARTPTGNFSVTNINDTIYFSAADSSFGYNVQYHWGFGDGINEDYYNIFGRKTKHYYSQNDTVYTAYLLMRTPCSQAYGTYEVILPPKNVFVETVAFPNPVSEKYLRIRSPNINAITNINIYNYLGQALTFETSNIKTQGFDILLDKFITGIYVLRIEFGKDVVVKKIIIQ